MSHVLMVNSPRVPTRPEDIAAVENPYQMTASAATATATPNHRPIGEGGSGVVAVPSAGDGEEAEGVEEGGGTGEVGEVMSKIP
ncbi:hypothetical protein ABZ930_30085 [Streptomyces sp. NPDC046716]|uniref:hypothetical protein n=1 Tax=Streptomyces sp. NPDC046716 TaxID=3157093 RepID=UPI0033EDE459